MYLSGHTSSNTGTVIAISGSHQSTYGGGIPDVISSGNDAFLVKFDASGVRQWGTYYGGSGNEYAHSCRTDVFYNIYMAGYTSSSTGTVIATSGAHQPNFGGGGTDAFLVKFDANGVRQWATYYGGSNNDGGFSCCTDASGNVYLSGWAYSIGTVIATSGSHQSTSGGADDAFLVKFDANGVRQWGTYYGDSSGETSYSCSTDIFGNVYMSGLAYPSTGTVIATSGSHQSAFGGALDAFLVKFDGNGVRQWGTYYGGLGDDCATYCTTDASGNVYLTGYTDSSTGSGIATSVSFQSTNGGGLYDAFLVKFDGNGARQWGTYYGGSGYDLGTSCSVDNLGNIYMAGSTDSSTGTIIATSGSYQSACGGVFDAFLVKFDAIGLRLWGTYYGSVGQDYCGSCSTDVFGNVYVPGATDSNIGAAIASASSHQPAFGGGTFDAFLVKFTDCIALTPMAAVSNTLCSGATLNFTASITSSATPTYAWTGPNSFMSFAQNPSITESGLLNMGIYTLTVNNDGCVETTTTEVTAIYATNPTASLISPACLGANLNFAGNIAGSNTATYSWAGPNSFTSSTQNPSIIGANILNVGTYTLVVNNNGCTGTATTQVTSINANPTITVNSGAICIGNTFTIAPTGASTYTIQGGNNVVNPTSNSSYTVFGTSAEGCLSNMATSTVNVNNLPNVFTSTSNSIICGPLFQDSATLTASGATSYTWSNGSNASSIVVSPSLTTTYSITGTDANGCNNTAFITQSVSACTGLSKITATSNLLSIYPNPANDLLNIVTSVNADELVSIQIINNLGQVLYQSEIRVNESTIPVNHVANGIYYVQLINTSHQTNTQKFLIQR